MVNMHPTTHPYEPASTSCAAATVGRATACTCPSVRPTRWQGGTRRIDDTRPTVAAGSVGVTRASSRAHQSNAIARIGRKSDAVRRDDCLAALHGCAAYPNDGNAVRTDQLPQLLS